MSSSFVSLECLLCWGCHVVAWYHLKRVLELICGSFASLFSSFSSLLIPSLHLIIKVWLYLFLIIITSFHSSVVFITFALFQTCRSLDDYHVFILAIHYSSEPLDTSFFIPSHRHQTWTWLCAIFSNEWVFKHFLLILDNFFLFNCHFGFFFCARVCVFELFQSLHYPPFPFDNRPHRFFFLCLPVQGFEMFVVDTWLACRPLVTLLLLLIFTFELNILFFIWIFSSVCGCSCGRARVCARQRCLVTIYPLQSNLHHVSKF